LAHRSAAGVLADDKLIDCPARCQWLSTLIVDGRWEAPYGRWGFTANLPLAERWEMALGWGGPFWLRRL
jgi:hypothetical protein